MYVFKDESIYTGELYRMSSNPHTRTSEIHFYERFLDVVRSRTGTIALSCLLSTLSSALQLAPFLGVYWIAQHLMQGTLHSLQNGTLWWIALGVLLSVLLKSAALSASLYFSHLAAYDILYEARMTLAKKLGTLSLGFFDRRNTGSIKRILHEDIEQMEQGIAHLIPDLVSGLAVPLLMTVAMYCVDWRMATVVLGSAIFAFFGFSWMMRVFGSEGMKRYYELSDQMNSAVIQYINGMKLIKIFTRSDSSFAELKETILEMSAFYNEYAEQIQRPYSLVEVTFRATPLFVIPASVYGFMHGMLSLPVVLFFILLSLVFLRPLYNALMMGIMAMHQLQNGWTRIDALLAEKSLEDKGVDWQAKEHTIQLRSVSFSYHAVSNDLEKTASKEKELQYAIRDLSLTIPEGQVTALVGPSGSGKTTIARLIPRFWDVTSGSIEIGGTNVRDVSLFSLMEHVSFVFQDVFLFNDSFAENIRVGQPTATHEDIVQAAKHAHCHEFIMELGGYDVQIGENGNRLSGGQRQRLSLARAILKDAPIIVLDEATAFVDPESENQIQEALALLIHPKDGVKKTLLVVAHRIATIVDAQQIVVMDKGQISARGTHQELLQESALYRTLWEADQFVEKHSFSNAQNASEASDAFEVRKPVQVQPQEPQKKFENPFSSLLQARTTFQKIMALTHGEKKLFWTGVAWKYIEGMCFSAPAFVVYWILLALMSGYVSNQQLLGASVLLLLIYLGQYIFNYLSNMQLLQLDSNMQKNLRMFLSDYLRRLPLGFFTKRDAGTIDSLFTTQIQFLETRIFTTMFILAIVGPSILFLFSLSIHWQMALSMAAGVPLAVWILMRSTGLFERVWKAQSEARKDANKRMIEYIQGIQVIRAFNVSGERFEQFETAMDTYRQTSFNTSGMLAPAIAGFLSALELGFAVLLLVGTYWTQNQTILPQTFLIFMLLGLFFYTPMMLAGELMAIQRIMNRSIAHVKEFLTEPLLPEPVKHCVPNGYEIEFEQVSFRYKDADVLKDISFSIPENQTVALVGASGAGKTTIMHLIARFWDVQKGSVKIGGVSVQELSADTLLQHITIVFQDVYLFHGSLLDNIRFAHPTATHEEIEEAARLACAHDFIMEFPDGYDTIVGEGGSTLSGGQKQRISIARAILKDAPIVMLDEATASLDRENEYWIQRALHALTRNKTVLVIAHRLTTVQDADQILVLEQGQIRQAGTHTELVQEEGLYQHFWTEKQKTKSWKL